MNTSILIDISQLRVGMYIQLNMGWMNHPFPVSSFRVASPEQIATLRALNLSQVRYIPSKSDPSLADLPLDEPVRAAGTAVPQSGQSAMPPEELLVRQRRLALEIQVQGLEACERRFGEATRGYLEIAETVDGQPDQARELSDRLVAGCVDDLLTNGDSVIRLLSEDVGVRSAQHPVNVMVLCLLLGKAQGMQGPALKELGVAALLHDLGKLALPPQVAEPHGHLSAAEMAQYQSHVGESVVRAERMGLPVSVVTAIAQHHEWADGAGFPLRLLGGDLGRIGQILALVNHYDRLCNPAHGREALTPHEALSVMFAQHKARFDSVILGAFIRMMGVYPPGSIVQLGNDRYAIVVSVNSSRPLRPRVVVHDPSIPKEQALVLDLESTPELGIRRSLRPSQLPREALDYLSPRQRVCYFFERAVSLVGQEVGA